MARVLANTFLSIDLSYHWTNATLAMQSTPKTDDCVSLKYPSPWYQSEEQVLYSGFAGLHSIFDHREYDLNNMSICTFKTDGPGSGTWNDTIPAGSKALASLNRPEQAIQALVVVVRRL